jgi:hypothetical protein
MKTALLLAAWICFALPATAHTQQTPKPAKEERTVGTYQNIKANGPFKVTLVNGEPGTLTLNGEAQMLDIITTEVTDGTLQIYLADGKALPLTQKVEIKVPFKQLDRIDLVGSGQIDVNRTIRNDIKVTLDGCGSINLKAYNDNVDACVLGQGEIRLEGNTDNFTCKIIGCGHIAAYSLDAENVKACISGSGTIETECKTALTGRISGNGNITFSGNPDKKDLMRSGQGEFTML